MGIVYYEKEGLFMLTAGNSSYVISITDDKKYLGHVYFGKKINFPDCTYLLRTHENPFVPSVNKRDEVAFMDAFPFEYPGEGEGDFRNYCVSAKTELGFGGVQLQYESHKIMPGKPQLPGLPSTFGSEKDVSTLIITCSDSYTGLKAELYYSVFEQLNVITRSLCLTNDSKKNLELTKALSACVTLDSQNKDIITLHGSWARERHQSRHPISYGSYVTESLRGETSHQGQPFMAVLSKDANQKQGEVYGINLIYSGNFIAEANVNQFDSLRVTIGIHPDKFCWKLEPEESFVTPEAVLVYSDQGIGGMSRTFHDLYRNHLIRSPYKTQRRPVLINSWEASYFNFSTKSLLKLAKEAAEQGIELFVLDDGWFGKRESDNSSLGDWFVNTEKLPGGLEYLSEQIHALGMKFGLWIEPEMISPDSDLYRAHPDWALGIPEREKKLSRNQFVLDITRKEVREYLYDKIGSILKKIPIEYVKWDMNRPLTDIGSLAFPPERQGELYHRYVLALYEMQERFVTEFPSILLENCSGGGGRFDPGMLYYSPQIWCSDDTDAIERLSIQEGTAMVYPLSCIGAHVSVCPNHIVGRNTPFMTRGYVALAGTFGYELDIAKLSAEEKKLIPEQISLYNRYGDLVRSGDYYRLASFKDSGSWDSWEIVSKDKTKALITVVQVLNRANVKSRNLKVEGLCPNSLYTLKGEGALSDFCNKVFADKLISGATLMNAGILIPPFWGDFQSGLLYLETNT